MTTWKAALTNASYVDAYTTRITAGKESIIFEFNYPTYLTEERSRLLRVVDSIMKTSGLSDGTTNYDYLAYWERVESYLSTHTVQEWLLDIAAPSPPIRIVHSSDPETEYTEMYGVLNNIRQRLTQIDTLLVWTFRATREEEVITGTVRLSGEHTFSSGTCSFSFGSDSNEQLSYDRLPYVYVLIHTED